MICLKKLLKQNRESVIELARELLELLIAFCQFHFTLLSTVYKTQALLVDAIILLLLLLLFIEEFKAFFVPIPTNCNLFHMLNNSN